MQFVFLGMDGKTLFIRDDAEQAHLTREEMTLSLEFPRIDGKVISIGQRVLFYDPDTKAPQIYEIKQAKTLEPDHYQAVTAEHICISELSDEHIDKAEITDKKASEALQTLLSGTLWQVGIHPNNEAKSSMDVSRGSVWQAILQIKTNWNVYIEPRVIIGQNGAITRYLDIVPTSGEWHGVRLSIDKNLLSPSVTYDDSEVVTALYGYGGTTTPTAKGEEPQEITFKDIAWAKTADHPAKPAGQTYIEDPEATAAYGRNNRARFGYYQNTQITDPETLLQKTWEVLKQSAKPAVSIDGTVADLYCMGYADEPIKLHDIALVEILPAGYKERLQIIRMTTDLLDPTQTTVTIGSYIPNIVYIQRDSIESITGTRGPSGSKDKQPERSEYETAILKNNREIQLRAYQNDLDDLDNEVKLQEARITVEHNRITQEVTDRRNADNILDAKITVEAGRITQEVTERKGEDVALSSKIEQTASQIRTEVKETTSQLYSSVITQTSSMIKAEVATNNSTVYSTITQTASQIRSEVASTSSGLYSSVITQTSNMIKSEVATNNSTVYSSIEQTASQIRSEVVDTTSSLYSSVITQTSNMIKSEVSTNNSTVYSTITQTASQIRSEVASTSSGLYSSVITQTSSMIKSEVSTNNSKVYSSIKQESDRIDLVVTKDGNTDVVNTASIVAGINGQTGSYVKIQAATINLSGYVTASQLSATQADIDNLMAGNTTAAWIKANQGNIPSLTVGNNLTFKSHGVYWQGVTIGTTNYHFMGYVG